jgi:hypothetical protein
LWPLFLGAVFSFLFFPALVIVLVSLNLVGFNRTELWLGGILFAVAYLTIAGQVGRLLHIGGVAVAFFAVVLFPMFYMVWVVIALSMSRGD